MSEILNELFKALAPWPALQFAGAVALIYLMFTAMRRGERDRKSGHGGEASTPRWFTNEQTLEILREIRDEARQQTQLLEQIANENMINPRRLQE